MSKQGTTKGTNKQSSKKQSTKKQGAKKNSKETLVMDALKKEIFSIVLTVFILFCGVSIYTNKMGFIGEVIRNGVINTFGTAGYLLPVYFITLQVLIIFKKIDTKMKVKAVLVFILLLLVSAFAYVLSIHSQYLSTIGLSGGAIGTWFGKGLIKIFGDVGVYIFLVTSFVIEFMILTEQSFIKLMLRFKGKMEETSSKLKDNYEKTKESMAKEAIEKNQEVVDEIQVKDTKDLDFMKQFDPTINVHDAEANENKRFEEACNEEILVGEQIALTNIPKAQPQEELIEVTSQDMDYDFPSIELLNPNRQGTTNTSKNSLLKKAKILEDSLKSFGVDARVVQVNKGPTVTRFELQPSQGVKVSKIVNLADDIALNLAASGIRIEAPIPGKSVVGIEVPNEDKQAVNLREIIENDNFKKYPSRVAVALGKDIDGNAIVTDLAKMPHLLIAGATGSGKSVCINSLIISLIYKAHPNDVKMILIDPKVVELSIYNGIPHLLIPVVNDPQKAAGALNWAVQEMTTRYKKFAETNVRDVTGFNKMVKEHEGEEDFEYEKMPQLIVIIDELADLMMVAAKEVEEYICRLAQMARAAGIHLVIATQRPSVDVITGVIKANIPSRLAFAVSSGIDSRTILDSNGAEKLLGRGDMLFMPIGMSKPIRIQGAFVSDKEVENIVNSIKVEASNHYSATVEEKIQQREQKSYDEEEADEYLKDAIELVVGKQKASISMLQRVFRIGFNRASRLMDALHEKGIVGPEEGSKPRKVLMTREEYNNKNI